MVARGLELARRQRRAGTQDPDQGAPHELAGTGGLLLVTDRHFAAGGEQPVHVIVQRVVRNAGHGDVLPLGEGETEQPRSGRGILIEHFEEIAEAEEQQRAGREAALDLRILLHHRRLSLGRHGLCI